MQQSRQKSRYFEVCKQSKSAFYSAKRKFSDDPTSENKENFLRMRSEYMKAKRCC